MDCGGSDASSSLSEAERPCLIVEDSQPDGGLLDEDPDGSYRAALGGRMAGLQRSSPVLELISSPTRSRCFQPDSQSEHCERICVSAAEGTSQLEVLELSESQIGDEERWSTDRPDSQSDVLMRDGAAKQEVPTHRQEVPTHRQEVNTHSSQVAALDQQGGGLRDQDLLHPRKDQQGGGLRDQDLLHPRKDQHLLSSQDDLFDHRAGCDEERGVVMVTPASTLCVLQLSGHQSTLVEQSLSEGSVDFVAPTPDSQPVIVPNSPTAPPHHHDASEPMDTSFPPADQSGEKIKSLKTEDIFKPRPFASTPVSQNSTGFVMERTLSVPSQPEFSHDVFIPTQSQGGGHGCSSLSEASAMGRPTLQQDCSLVLQVPEDSQDTQIEELDQAPGGTASTKPKQPTPTKPALGSEQQSGATARSSASHQASCDQGRSAPPSSTLDLMASQADGRLGQGMEKIAGPDSCILGLALSQSQGSPGGAKMEPSCSASLPEDSSRKRVWPANSRSQPTGSRSQLVVSTLGATPPLLQQLKQTPRHSTPIETSSLCGKPAAADVSMATSDITAGEDKDSTEQPHGKLSLRMKLVTPVEEGSSENFSLQKPALCDGGPSAVASAGCSPSVFTRVRQAQRNLDDRVQRLNSPASPLDWNSLSNSQSQPSSSQGSNQEVLAAPLESLEVLPAGVEEPEGLGASRQTITSQQTGLYNTTPTPPRKAEQQPRGPAHRRHVRTVQEVRTTVTRIITDVYYEDGKEVQRKVTQESEEPLVEVLEVSPCRTGSSLTPGDLGDVSSLSSDRPRPQFTDRPRPQFTAPPPGRGAKPARGGGAVVQSTSSSEERSPHLCPPQHPASPVQSPAPSHSECLRWSPEEGSSASSSLVGLRVVAKWSSNGFFYSGRITGQVDGDARFTLRFDDGYECEVAGKDILLCDPIPVETEVTALLEEQFFSVGTVKGHRTEQQELFYSVERDAQCHWFPRSAVILSIEQGNRLREQYSLGPYEPTTPLAKASDISLDNLVEGKRRRRGGPVTPSRSSSDSPRTAGPSGKRKLIGSEQERTPAKRGRKGAGPRVVQKVGAVNTSGSGSDLQAWEADPGEAHGPLPQNGSLFLGFAFLLTTSSEVDRQSNQPISDSEEEYVQTAPYNRRYTEEQLKAGGGIILPDFNQEQCNAAYQSLLICDQHCRTRKYLLCVASGVPCVSHIWVRDCCRDNKLLSHRNYLLPAGVGPEERIVEWHPVSRPLAALRLLVAVETLGALWCELGSLSGAEVGQYRDDRQAPDLSAGTFDVVVTDRGCPPLVQQSVMSRRIPLVSPEWLIHSIICGERLSYDASPMYRHDYRSE